MGGLGRECQPLALVLMAPLKAQESRGNRQQILALFCVIDWLLQLPEDLERDFTRELTAFEEQEKMPYITSVERIGRQEGRQEGWREGRQEGRQEGEAAVLLRLITLKFGPPSESVRQRVQEADAETLLQWSERVLTAQGLDEVLR